MAEFILDNEQLQYYQDLIDEKRYIEAKMWLMGGLEQYIFSNVIEQSFALWFYTLIDVPKEVLLSLRAKRHKGGVA